MCWISVPTACLNTLLANTPGVLAVTGSCSLRKDVAYEPSTENDYPLPLAFPELQDLEPPFCFSTIFDQDLTPNVTNEFDTVLSFGYRLPSAPQTLNVPFRVEVGPSIRVSYYDGIAEFAYVSRLGKGTFTYLTVCVTGSGPFTVSAYVRGCEVNPDLGPRSVTAVPEDIPETTLVYLGEDQAPFEVSFALIIGLCARMNTLICSQLY